ncbi:hypothetical protein ACTXT7_004412 [Hymenolepis weldensis]
MTTEDRKIIPILLFIIRVDVKTEEFLVKRILLYDQKLKQMENCLDDPEALRHILNNLSSASENLELDREVCDHEVTRKLKSLFMKISAIVPNYLENYFPVEMNCSCSVKMLKTKEAQIATRALEIFLLFKKNIFIFYLSPHLYYGTICISDYYSNAGKSY